MKCAIRKGAKVFAGFVIAYIVAYFALMTRSHHAVDWAEQKIAFKSAFRFARVETTMQNGLTTTFPCTSPANYVFVPLDVIYFNAFPSSFQTNQDRFPLKNWWPMQ
jgi:hypothetical protein